MTQKTFVLVHGAWHGGWCWRRVADRLEKQGHKVFTPTLTGLGERSHLMSPGIDLDTHINDVVNVIKWEDLKGVCLVAHSYGGWPVSGALEKILDRVSSTVFLDADAGVGTAGSGVTADKIVDMRPEAAISITPSDLPDFLGRIR